MSTTTLQYRTLDELCDFYAGATLPTGSDYTGQQDGHLLLKVGDMNLSGNEKFINSTREWTLQLPNSATLAPADSIVFPKRGGAIGTNKKRLLRREAILDPNMMGVRARNGVDTRYLYHWFLQFDLTLISNGSTVPQLNKKDLAPLKIPLPPLPEQKRIAHILDKADAIRRKRQEGLLQSYNLRKSLLISFIGDAGSIHVRTDLEGTSRHLPTGFTWRKLEDICPIIADIDHKMPKAVESGVPFISPKDMPDDDDLDFTDVKYISDEDFDRLSRKIRPRRNDIIYSRIGARLGKAKLVKVDFPFLASYSCCTIRVNEEIAHPLYITHYLDSIVTRRQANLDTQSIAVPDLGLAKIKAFLLPVPSLTTQLELVVELQATEQFITRTKSSTKEADDLFNSLVQRAFKGEL